jgi:hypothetical protein
MYILHLSSHIVLQDINKVNYLISYVQSRFPDTFEHNLFKGFAYVSVAWEILFSQSSQKSATVV